MRTRRELTIYCIFFAGLMVFGFIVLMGLRKLTRHAEELFMSARHARSTQQLLGASLSIEQQKQAREPHGGIVTTEHAHGFSAFLSEEGVQVALSSVKPHRVSLTTRRFGCEGALEAISVIKSATQGQFTTFHHQGQTAHLVEWYTNSPDGLEQGFTVVAAPQCQKIAIEMTMQGDLYASLDSDEKGLTFRDEQGTPLLRYSNLYVEDSMGRTLPSHLLLQDQSVFIHIDAKNAVYPLVVDPLFTAVEQRQETSRVADVEQHAKKPSSALTCHSATTLNDLVTCIRNQMPHSGSNGFVVPTALEQEAFAWAVGEMMNGECDFALPATISQTMQVTSFVDAENGKSYCVLMEVGDINNDGDVDKGWGTFIVDDAATREVSHQAPHPLYDMGTEIEAVDIFKATNSRSFLMCGAHRNANGAASGCQRSFKEADCSHAIQTMFHAAVEELKAYYGNEPYAMIQWHGMGTGTCPGVNVYITEGLASAPDVISRASQLHDQAMLHNPTWNIDMAGEGTCSLNATDNVQGRLLNGVSSVNTCTTDANVSLGKFIHIEQQPAYRVASYWTQAVMDTFPDAAPEMPSNLAAIGSTTSVDLSWNALDSADSYEIFRGLASGGPYTLVASDVLSTTYTDVGLQPGTTYYYVVKGVNWAGDSVASNEAMVTTISTLAPPSGLIATTGRKKIALSWTATTGASSYSVKRSTTAAGPYMTIASGLTTTKYVNSNLRIGVTYYYVVTAMNGNGESGPSNEVFGMPY